MGGTGVGETGVCGTGVDETEVGETEVGGSLYEKKMHSGEKACFLWVIANIFRDSLTC